MKVLRQARGSKIDFFWTLNFPFFNYESGKPKIWLQLSKHFLFLFVFLFVFLLLAFVCLESLKTGICFTF